MMTVRLDPADHDWMTHPATLRVMAALEAAAPDGSRFVGGCVRNALLGVPVADIDIATVLEPEASQAALEAAGIAVHPTGIAHGTLTAVADHQPFEITTLRRDVSTDGRRATVAFTTNWAEDAARRDFRINALYADPDGTIHDLVGGLADIPGRRVVFIGRPQDRIAEDYLRILRFFRFYAFYGQGEPDAHGLTACAEMTDGLSQLSAERVWMETRKLFSAPDPVASLGWMIQAGVAQALYGQAPDTDRLERLIALGGDDPLLRFAAAFDPAERLIRPMKMSNEEASRLRLAGKAELAATIAEVWPVRAELEKLVYRHGNDAMADQLYLLFSKMADPPEGWGGAIAHVLSFAAPDFPVGGDDLKAAGLTPGPEMGKALRRMEEAWIDSRFRLSKEALLADR
ncbi:CCA tRNA nucleotidyltransferase [Hyphobacterium sp. HN65]|uniref:CCA tRNA nucleotidyltransferase n=1 Tax=Hyphobacterium lacteum TaxID=3116575 RepID=A0ABU7LRD2_9PROT|nr:CCA tRNA nucleotidyltransferase [Hyphobacterium sp. HN65]MEE2526462.1 CCA tRNA nucleotidyltransferase [Hyphobacterium sp. HN65]